MTSQGDKVFALRVTNSFGQPTGEATVHASIDAATVAGNRAVGSFLQWTGVGDEVHGTFDGMVVFVIQPGRLVRVNGPWHLALGIIPMRSVSIAFQRDTPPPAPAAEE